MKYTIIPSIIARSQAELDECIAKIAPTKSTLLHLDVMDGQFVPQTSLEFPCTLPTNLWFEAHLMVTFPTQWYLAHYKHLKSIILHYESRAHIHECIAQAKKNNKKIAIALNPTSPAEDLTQYLKHIDKILVMTVNPGKYGAPFISTTLNKIKHLRQMNPKIDISVDGGINPKTLAQCKAAGANQFVVGSYLQNAHDVKKAYNELKKVVE